MFCSYANEHVSHALPLILCHSVDGRVGLDQQAWVFLSALLLAPSAPRHRHGTSLEKASPARRAGFGKQPGGHMSSHALGSGSAKPAGHGASHAIAVVAARAFDTSEAFSEEHAGACSQHSVPIVCQHLEQFPAAD